MIAQWLTNSRNTLKTPIARLLIIASVLYFFLSIFTYHPDNKTVLFWASLGNYKLLNVWEVGARQYPSFSQFNYPPAHYVIDKALFLLAQLLTGPGYTEWLATPNDQDQFVSQLTRFAFATKAGLILFGIFSGFLLYRVVKTLGTPKQALVATALWLFNPITLYSIPIMGQNDVLAICFFLLGWLALTKRKVLATLFFGIGAAIKMIPLIWVPFLLMATSRDNWKQKIAIVAGSALVYGATLLPFTSNQNFQQSILTGNHNQRFLYAQLPLGFSEAISVVPLLLIMLVAGVLTKVTTSANRLALPAFTLMILNMLMLSFTHFHPQWWTWVVCFWSIWITTVDAKKIGVAIGASVLSFCAWLAIVILFKDTALNWGLLLPLNPNLANLPTITSILSARGTNVEQLVSLAYTWLAGCAVVGLALVFKGELPAVHEKLTLPTKLVAFWRWLTATNLRQKSSLILLLVTTAMALVVVAQAVPAPRTSQSPDNLYFRPLVGAFRTTIMPLYNNFNRFELYMKNPDLSPEGAFSVQVVRDATLIHQQEIKGQNIGGWSMVRFDIPPQPTSSTTPYTITITPTALLATEPKELLPSSIEVGSTNDADPTNSLAVKQFFAPDQTYSLAQRSLTAIKTILWQVPTLVVLLLLTILFLA